jgi:hypothetical protein
VETVLAYAGNPKGPSMTPEEAASSSSPVVDGQGGVVQSIGEGSAESSGPNDVLCATIESRFVTLGDAEDASHGVVADLLDDIIADMRVTDENDRAFHIAASLSWRHVLDGCVLAAVDAVVSLDADSDSLASRPRGRLPQFLRPRIDEGTATLANRTRRRRRLNHPTASVVSFLTELWRSIDHNPALLETELAQFPTSHFQVSAVPTHGRQGEWGIPAEDLKPLLRRIAGAACISVVGSAVDYVISANASLLGRRAKLQMSHIVLCVQTALLKVEEESIDEEIREATATTPSVFQTEVVIGSSADENDEFLVCYDAGDDPPLLTIDRNATRSLSHKSELGSTVTKRHRMAMSIVSLLQQQCRESDATKTKWGTIRKRLLVRETPPDDTLGIGVGTNTALPLQKSATAATLLRAAASSPKRKVPTLVSSSPMTPSPSKSFSEPDAATLSNIFSLGTPRQLSSDELARRNDILSLLEREDATASRKMAVASITAVSVPACVGPDGKPILSDQDKVLQAYVAANSSITMTSGSCAVPASLEGSPNKGSNVAAAEPRRGRGGTDVNNGKTRFELALEPPRFDVTDGNSLARWAAAASVPGEPMGRKARSLKSPELSTSVSPVPPTKKTPNPPSSQQVQSSPSSHHPRPIDTASGHLPQLDTNRLAVGVNAVVRGIEKRGPRHDPSRNSRLRLHNYMVHLAATTILCERGLIECFAL